MQQTRPDSAVTGSNAASRNSQYSTSGISNPSGGPPSIAARPPQLVPIAAQSGGINLAPQPGLPRQPKDFDVESHATAAAISAALRSNNMYSDQSMAGFQHPELVSGFNNLHNTGHGVDLTPGASTSGVYGDMNQHPVTSTSSASKTPIPAFLSKLYDMVDKDDTQNLIHWSPSGDSFIVPSAEKLGRDVLPQYFKHSNFGSFVRQLNMYGFHKVPHLRQGVMRADPDGGNDKLEFSNEFFKRGQPKLLELIQRKKATTDGGHNDASQVDVNNLANEMQLVRRSQSDLSTQMRHLNDSYQRLLVENMQLREKQMRQQDTIGKIGRFLSAVFGNQVVAAITGNGSIPGALSNVPSNATASSASAEPSSNSVIGAGATASAGPWQAFPFQGAPAWAHNYQAYDANNFTQAWQAFAAAAAASHNNRMDQSFYDKKNSDEDRVHEANSDSDDNEMSPVHIAEVDSDIESLKSGQSPPSSKRVSPYSRQDGFSKKQRSSATSPTESKGASSGVLQKWTPQKSRRLIEPKASSGTNGVSQSPTSSKSNIWSQFGDKVPSPEDVVKYLARNDPAAVSEAFKDVVAPNPAFANQMISYMNQFSNQPVAGQGQDQARNSDSSTDTSAPISPLNLASMLNFDQSDRSWSDNRNKGPTLQPLNTDAAKSQPTGPMALSPGISKFVESLISKPAVSDSTAPSNSNSGTNLIDMGSVNGQAFTPGSYTGSVASTPGNLPGITPASDDLLKDNATPDASVPTLDSFDLENILRSFVNDQSAPPAQGQAQPQGQGQTQGRPPLQPQGPSQNQPSGPPSVQGPSIKSDPSQP